MAWRRVVRDWLRGLALLPATILFAAGLFAAAAPLPVAENSLAGQLLVASPRIADPRFYHAVVLMVRQDKNGALGIVINRPVGMRSLASILAATGDKTPGITGEVEVFAGGPVEPRLGFVIHSSDYRGPHTLVIDKELAMTTSRQILRDMGRHKGPKKTLVAFGYAGWAPGQLQAELARHDWFTTPADLKLVFDEDRADLWAEAKARRTRSL